MRTLAHPENPADVRWSLRHGSFRHPGLSTPPLPGAGTKSAHHGCSERLPRCRYWHIGLPDKVQSCAARVCNGLSSMIGLRANLTGVRAQV